jgi:DNA invertase Pin-like site-specific DNA recombinase
MSHARDVVGHPVGQRVGYTRVSTVAQNLDQRNDAPAEAGLSKTFSDNMFGARDDRSGRRGRNDRFVAESRR